MPGTSLSAASRERRRHPVEAERLTGSGHGRGHPGRVVGGVDDDRGAAPEDLQPPGRADLGERLPDQVRVERSGLVRTPANASTAASAQAALPAWCSAEQRQEDVLVGAAQAAQRTSCWPPSACSRLSTPNSTPSRATVAPTSPRALAAAPRPPSGCCASTATAPGLMMPAFSAAISSIVCRAAWVWSMAIGVITATAPSATLVQSEPAAHADLDHHHVHRRVGEDGEGHPGQDLEEGHRRRMLARRPAATYGRISS
jgi:hypothetical protein